jgi:hypothetical protein
MPLLNGYLIQRKLFSVFLGFLFIDTVSYWVCIALMLYGWICVWLRKHNKILKVSYLSLRCPGTRRPTLRKAVRSFRRRIERFASKGLPSGVHLIRNELQIHGIRLPDYLDRSRLCKIKIIVTRTLNITWYVPPWSDIATTAKICLFVDR